MRRRNSTIHFLPVAARLATLIALDIRERMPKNQQNFTVSYIWMGSGFYRNRRGKLSRREQTGKRGAGRLASKRDCHLGARLARIWFQLSPLIRRPHSFFPRPPARCRPGAPRKFAPAPSGQEGAAESGAAGSFAAGRTCVGAELGSQRGPGPACSAHGESRAHLSVAPRELQKTSALFIGANRPCARLAPARLNESWRARVCLQPVAG